MIITTIITLILAKSLVPSYFNSILINRITAISLLYSSVLAINTVNFQAIGSGIGIYSGLFQVTTIGQFIEIFVYLVAALIITSSYASDRGSSFIENLKEILIKNNNKFNSLYEISSNSIYNNNIKEKENLTEYSLIILFSTLGVSFLISSADLISMYLSLELQSFSLYILATLARNSISSTSAGLKYFLLGGLSSAIILLGSGIIYSFTGLTNLESIYLLLSVSDDPIISSGFSLGLILIVIGFLFKIGAAPLHNWAPDVYDSVPTFVTTWLTIIPKLSILVFLFELKLSTTNVNLSSFGLGNTEGLGTSLMNTNIILDSIHNVKEQLETIWTGSLLLSNLFLISSLLSLIVGSVVGLAQSRIKRLLAYSTISHLGFILLSLSINTEQSAESFIFYIIQYTITNLNLFLILLAFSHIFNVLYYNKTYITKSGTNNNTILKEENVIENENSELQYISELKGQFYNNSVLSISFAICLSSLAGVPPLIGFFGKASVLYSSNAIGYFFWSFVAIIVSVISAFYYLKIIKVVFFDSDNKENGTEELTQIPLFYNIKNNIIVKNINTDKYMTLENVPSLIISILTLIILLFIFNPDLIFNSIHLLAISLFYV
jgi:NADH-ubiquinone oxidoreductase chain 2